MATYINHRFCFPSLFLCKYDIVQVLWHWEQPAEKLNKNIFVFSASAKQHLLIYMWMRSGSFSEQHQMMHQKEGDTSADGTMQRDHGMQPEKSAYVEEGARLQKGKGKKNVTSSAWILGIPWDFCRVPVLWDFTLQNANFPVFCHVPFLFCIFPLVKREFIFAALVLYLHLHSLRT